MNLNLDQQVSVSVLEGLVGFSGKTDLGGTSVNKVAGGNFTIHVSDFQGGRLRNTSFIFDERGKQIFSGSELPAQLELGPPGTQSSHEYVSMPFTAREVIAAISKAKAQVEGLLCYPCMRHEILTAAYQHENGEYIITNTKTVATKAYEEVVLASAQGGDVARCMSDGFVAVEREKLKQLPEAERFLSGLTGFLKATADKDVSDGIRNGFGPTFKVMVANVIQDVQDVGALLHGDPSLMSEWNSYSDSKDRARLITRLEQEGKLKVRQHEELWMGWTGYRVEGYLATLNG